MTPIYHVTPTADAARRYVRGTMDNVEADAERTTGGWHPVARLRADQGWLRARLTERGIKCVGNTSAAHVSPAMMEAGAQAAHRAMRAGIDARDAVREIYLAMEAQR